MSPDQFRLVLGICAAIAALGFLASVDPVLMVIVVILAISGAALYLLYRAITWMLRRFN